MITVVVAMVVPSQAVGTVVAVINILVAHVTVTVAVAVIQILVTVDCRIHSMNDI